MREIKFRVWDGKNKYMYYPTCNLCVSWDSEYGSKLFQGVQRDSGMRDCCDSDYELMQFTGLFDKDGKEIWEGDIVKFTYDSGFPIQMYTDKYAHSSRNGTTMIDVVKFIDGAFVFEPLDNSNMYSFAIRHSEFCRVIGNIYDNPKLLRKD